ncbi:ATP-binding cassette domain-containing protein [Virgibacillus halophilus]|uniref:ATP-binding cassette domain-containing protein n=1 Tax=Tigheibacillus halophilus TaxID=361280 RepID=A0ABU5C526_9BACI|nr:ATP-binding cassette domain-containing protein [Virgibacillus halophilus]
MNKYRLASSDAKLAIHMTNLTKTYRGGVRALNGLSFSVKTGTIFALLGPNGAGKSTVVKILTTLSRPDRGEAQVAGIDVTRNESPNYSALAKSFFSWQGVTMYLSKEEGYQTLNNISKVAPSGSMVVFDYFSIDEFHEETTSTDLLKKEQMMNKLGEPMKTGFDPTSMQPKMAKLGLDLVENLSPMDIEKRYMTGLNENLKAHKNVYFARAVVK